MKDNVTFVDICVKEINLTNRTEYIKEVRTRFNSYHTDEWEKSYFDEYSGGYCVYHKEHKFDPKKGKFGISRGEYEKRASENLLRCGKTSLQNVKKTDDKSPVLPKLRQLH